MMRYVKVFVCDCVQDIERAVNEYTKKQNVKSLKVSILEIGDCLAAVGVFERKC